MSESTASLRRQLESAKDLRSVVRTMKALAASNIGQYEAAVNALGDFHRAVELGLGVCLREADPTAPLIPARAHPSEHTVGAIVFGSDQGLVGQFNEVVATHALEFIAQHSVTAHVWAVGERVHARLADAGLAPVGLFEVPTSVESVAALVGELALEMEAHRSRTGYATVYVFHNRPKPGALYDPVEQRLLPLDAEWERRQAAIEWPTRLPPEVIGGRITTLRDLIREYLFISLFRACAESLASENASRLSAMERADKNIGEMLDDLGATFHRLRQRGIDEELFDVVAGYDALFHDPHT